MLLVQSQYRVTTVWLQRGYFRHIFPPFMKKKIIKMKWLKKRTPAHRRAGLISLTIFVYLFVCRARYGGVRRETILHGVSSSRPVKKASFFHPLIFGLSFFFHQHLSDYYSISAFPSCNTVIFWLYERISTISTLCLFTAVRQSGKLHWKREREIQLHYQVTWWFSAMFGGKVLWLYQKRKQWLWTLW
jgi:hypothetical protein